MRNWKDRNRRVAGETLIETLAAILLIVLSSLMMAQTAATAFRLNIAAKEEDARFRAQMKIAEAGTAADEDENHGTVAVKNSAGVLVEYPVIYSQADEEGALASYRLKP